MGHDNGVMDPNAGFIIAKRSQTGRVETTANNNNPVQRQKSNPQNRRRSGQAANDHKTVKDTRKGSILTIIFLLREKWHL